MPEPSRVLSPEETTLFIAELLQRWREAGDVEKERLACVLDRWLRTVTESSLKPPYLDAQAREHAASRSIDDVSTRVSQ